MTHFDFGTDFFNPSTGYVIDGVAFSEAEAARDYLVRTMDMTQREANSMLGHMAAAFQRRAERGATA